MISTTTTVASGTNPSTYGNAVTFSATVTPGTAGAPMTGTVTFFQGNVRFGSSAVTWNSMTHVGQATLSASAMLGGTTAITAAYSGDGNYAQSISSVLTQTVNTAAPSVGIGASPFSSVYGQPVTLTAIVGYPAPGLLSPTGTVTFHDGASSIGTAVCVPTSNPSGAISVATLVAANFAVGTHTLTASYPGDGNYSSGTSSPQTLTVSKANTHTALTSSVNPSGLCQSVTFAANVTAVSPGRGTPTGSVTFYVNGSSVATITLAGGVATYGTSTLAQGSNSISAQYNGDSNFNTNISSLTQTVNAAVNWVLAAAPAAPDAQQALLVSFGPAKVTPLTGALLRHLPIDADQHAVCGCGGKCGCGGGCGGGCGCTDDNCQAGSTPLGLAYISATAGSNVLPIVLVTLASDFCAAVPSQIQAQLTWNGTAQGWNTYATTGHTAGDVYALPLQVGTAVGSSGIYPWSVEVKATVGTIVYDRTASGILPVVVNAAGNGLGNGWAIAGTWSLLIGSAGIAMVDNRTGGVRYFTGTGPTYTSPANDQGTLVKNMDGSYTYTSKEQLKTNFNSSGQMTTQVDPHSLTQTLTYSAGLLSTIAQPDGGVATLTYSGGLLHTVQEPGGRTLTLTYDAHSNLTGFVDAASGIYTLAYDSAHRLVNEQVGPINATYTYSTA